MLGKNNVLVVGTGTIGEPLIGLLCHFKDQLGIDDVCYHKNTPLLNDRSKVQDLIRRGARIVTHQEKIADFKEIGIDVGLTMEDALEASRVVIDCTPMVRNIPGTCSYATGSTSSFSFSFNG